MRVLVPPSRTPKEKPNPNNKSNSRSKQPLKMHRCRMNNSKKLPRTSLLQASELLAGNLPDPLSHQSMWTVDRNQFTHQLFDNS